MAENTQQRIDRINRLVTDDVNEFNRALLEFAKTLVPNQLVLLQRRLVLEVLRRVVLKTPVDTGRARGNWQVGIGSIPEGETDSTVQDNVGAIVTEAEGKLRSLGFGQVVWVANNLDYIVFLEDGSSSQAPNGMLRVTLEEVRSIFP